jgi:hypothetical protein
MAKIFFVDNVLIVEGDTEDIVIRETLQRMPNELRKDILHNWHVVKARGKATIISLVKYLNAWVYDLMLFMTRIQEQKVLKDLTNLFLI